MKIGVIGIDPGINGGIVYLTNGKITAIQNMPSCFKEILEYFIFLGFPNAIKKEDTHVYREYVHSMPTDSRTGAFSFGRHNGHLDAVCDCMDIKANLVSPQAWQRYFGLKRESTELRRDYKKRLLQFSQRQAGKKWGNKLTLKTCDAYLIALYGYYQQLNKGNKSI